MRNTLTLFLLLLPGVFIYAQVKTTNYTVDENSVIRDSTGRQITKIEFYEAVISGNYQFKPVKDKTGTIVEYLLIRCDKKENNQKISFSSSSQCAPTTALTVGQLAPDFSGKDMSDTVTYDLNYYKGRKVVVLNFWFASCAPCIHEIPDLNRLYDRYSDRADIVFVAPTFEFQEVIDSFLSKYHFKYPILPEAYEAIKNYKAIAYPLNVVIDFDGRIAFVSAGGLSGIEYLLDKKIRDLLGITKDFGTTALPIGTDISKANKYFHNGSDTMPQNSSKTNIPSGNYTPSNNLESNQNGGTIISAHPATINNIDTLSHH